MWQSRNVLTGTLLHGEMPLETQRWHHRQITTCTFNVSTQFSSHGEAPSSDKQEHLLILDQCCKIGSLKIWLCLFHFSSRWEGLSGGSFTEGLGRGGGEQAGSV